ncbi:MAG: Hsp20/alpha crystallin family protein [Bacteroidales bacterium]
MLPLITRNNTYQNTLSNFFDNFLEPNTYSSSDVNIVENDKEYRLEVCAPGISKKDFNIKLDDQDRITISYSHKDEKEDHKENNEIYLKKSFSYEDFEESFYLPDNILVNKISAKMNDGILNIIIPKDLKEQKKIENKIIDIQ